jgi:hypothetical protein
MADRQNDQLRTDHAAELERIRNELERTRQDAERQDRLHREQRVEVEHLLKALVERVEADQARLIEERDHLGVIAESVQNRTLRIAIHKRTSAQRVN